MVKRVRGQFFEDGEGLERCDDDGLVFGRRPALGMSDGVLLHALVADADFIDPEHDAADLADRGPCEALVFMEGHEPSLNLDGLDVLRQLLAPAGDQVIPNVVLHDRDSGCRLLAHRIGAMFGCQVKLGE